MKNTILALQKLKEKTNKVIVYSSVTGKDSIVITDLAAKFFDDVLLIYMYKVKDLEYIENYKRFIASHYGTKIKIIEVPHYCLTTYIKTGFLGIKKDTKIKIHNFTKVEDSIKEKYKEYEYSLYGFRMTDSAQRMFYLKRKNIEFNIINWETKKVYPLSDWNTKEVLNYIQQKNLIKPVKYNNDKSQSVELTSIDYLLWLKTNWPDDYIKVCKVFPLVELKIFEHEYHKSEQNN